MRTKTIIDGFKNSQKFRVIMNGVMLNNITPKDLMDTRFGLTNQRVALWDAIQSLASMRRVEVIKPIGLTGTWREVNIQVDML